jgi:phosphate:Na+ symporter
MDDQVDRLYSTIKFYLTQISRESLSENESRRWADIMSLAINMEQMGDIIERVLQDIEDKKIDKGREFSQAGLEEIEDMHQRLMANLRLGLSVFLYGELQDAQKLLEEKVTLRDLEQGIHQSASDPPARQHASKHRHQLFAHRPDQRTQAY